MSGDPRVRALVEEILETHRTPEEVCQACPELLLRSPPSPEALRELEAQVDSLFPTTGPSAGPVVPPDGNAPRFRATTCRRCWAAGAWASSTRPGTCRLNRLVALKMLHRRRLRRPARAGAVPARSGGGGEPAPREHRRGL